MATCRRTMWSSIWTPRRDDPALYLIDFDAFFAAAAGANRAVTVAEGGTYGTDGYCPPDLAAAASAGDGSAAPYSDRYGRDMLLLEFLLMGRGLPADDPLGHWNREQLQRQFAAWRARSDPNCVRTLGHLDPATVFELNERERPTSVDLAIGLGLSLPERRVLRRVTELPRPTPAVLGYRPAVAKTSSVTGRPMLARPRPGRQPTPAGGPIQSLKPGTHQFRPKWKIELFDLGSFKSILIGFAIGLVVLIPPLIVLGLLGQLWTTAIHHEQRPATRASTGGSQKTAAPGPEKPRGGSEAEAVSEIEKLGGKVQGGPAIEKPSNAGPQGGK